MADQSELYAEDAPSRYRCRRCQGQLRSLEFDGEHEDCEPELDRIKQRDAQRQLHRDTAVMLRRLGYTERAQVHDVLAEGRW